MGFVSYRVEREKEVLDKTKRGIEKVVAFLQNDIKTSFKPGTGRLYKRTKSGKMHRASAPGQIPAVDSGQLRSNINRRMEGSTGIVSTQTQYASFLEFGTSQMAERPFMQPAIDRNRDKILELFKEG